MTATLHELQPAPEPKLPNGKTGKTGHSYTTTTSDLPSYAYCYGSERPFHERKRSPQSKSTLYMF
ncbi:unnamed protein product [Medioppia subpectinata]|uniref:Uncharacterized protein n=1 Tax=Medioppia subpectinata TaxID=1979941 RepID=A0A7R9KMJ9_9ACAR|nr:unnamed protein product [Medioppia subpectinata]CAG2106286.1 unnamed protein product [Medioppia subpectinata]